MMMIRDIWEDAMAEAVIVDAVRSPMGKGKQGGALSGVHAVDLLAAVLTGLVERNGIDPGTVDDVMIGCVSQAGEHSATPGRQAWLAAGYPTHVPSVTIERKCGSGQQALEFAAASIVVGLLLGAAAIFGVTLMVQQDTKPPLQAGDPATSVLNRVEYGDRT